MILFSNFLNVHLFFLAHQVVGETFSHLSFELPFVINPGLPVWHGRVSMLSSFCVTSSSRNNVKKSYIDPRGRAQSRPEVITIFTQVVRTSFSKLQNQAKITAVRDCGLAELIIVFHYMFKLV